MTGSNQHYIPQQLLRGFSAKTASGKIDSIFVFRAERIFPTNIRNIAAERHFYSHPNPAQQTLDDDVTAYEAHRLAEILNKFKQTPVDDFVDSTLAAELIAHLWLRGRHVLNTMGHFFGALSAIILHEKMRNPAHLGIQKFLGIWYPQPDSKFDKYLNEFLKSKGLWWILPVRVILKIFAATHTAKLAMNHSMEDVGKTLKPLLPDFQSSIHSAQCEQLKLAMAPQKMMEVLNGRQWRIVAAPLDGIILPDCIAIYLEADGTACPPGFETDSSDYVVMPLTYERMLVGYKNNNSNSLFSSCDINKKLASCCSEFFLARSRNHNFESLVPLIRSRYLERMAEVMLLSFRSGAADSTGAKQK